jgi:uncharacterized protein YaaN involved in tellurite resistance
MGTTTRIKDYSNKLTRTDGGNSVVWNNLDELNNVIRRLRPSPFSKISFNKRGRLRAFFDKYEKAENDIKRFIKVLDDNKRMLNNDIQTLSGAQSEAHKCLKLLRRDLEMLDAMREMLDEKIREMEANSLNPIDINFFKTDVIYALEDRRQHIAAVMGVHYTTIVVSESIIRTNRELISKIYTARDVTIPALRNSIMHIKTVENQGKVAVVVGDLMRMTGSTINELAESIGMQTDMFQDLNNAKIDLYDAIEGALNKAMSTLEDIDIYKKRCNKSHGRRYAKA